MAKIYSKEIRPKPKRFKKVVLTVMFFVLGRAFVFTNKFDSSVKKEISEWPEGYKIIFYTAYHGPSMGLIKRNNRIIRAKIPLDNADLSIIFKNVDSAFLMMTAQMGIPVAFAEHRFILKGESHLAMSLIRCLNVVQTYLFPRIIAKRLIRKLPKIPWYRRYFYRLRIYLLTVPLGI